MFQIFTERFSSSNSMSSGDVNESILTLKIVAKFLSLIESLPYQYREDPHTDKLMQACSKYRQKVGGQNDYNLNFFAALLSQCCAGWVRMTINY